MTVIREKQTINYPKPNSAAASDTESLHLGSVNASDNESVNDEPQSRDHCRTYRPPNLKFSHFEDLVNLKKSYGKKKLRRYQNRCVLQTLNEKDEDEDNFIVIMESYKSPFTRLLEDENALMFWNKFIEKSEAEQLEIINLPNTCDKAKQQSTNNDGDLYKPGRLSSRIRRTIKIRKNLSLEVVKKCEDDLIAFFKATPGDVYIKYPPTSFDRLLLHGIAQYHKLKSTSLQVNNDSLRSVEVHNVRENWAPTEQFLTDFIKQLRK